MPAFRSFVPAKRSPPYSLPLFARLDSVPTAPVSSPRACRNRPLPHCTKPLAAPPLALQSVSAAPLFPPTSAAPPIALPPPSPKAPSAAPPAYLALRLTIGSVCYMVGYVIPFKSSKSFPPITSLQPPQFQELTNSFAQRPHFNLLIINNFRTLSVVIGVVPSSPRKATQSFLSPLESAVTTIKPPKSFRICTYGKHRGEGWPGSRNEKVRRA